MPRCRPDGLATPALLPVLGLLATALSLAAPPSKVIRSPAREVRLR